MEDTPKQLEALLATLLDAVVDMQTLPDIHDLHTYRLGEGMTTMMALQEVGRLKSKVKSCCQTPRVGVVCGPLQEGVGIEGYPAVLERDILLLLEDRRPYSE